MRHALLSSPSRSSMIAHRTPEISMHRYFTRLLALFAGFAFVSAANAQSAPASLVGTWRGSYVCLQGQAGDRFSGYFHFYPPRDNPVAREGCFSVNGRVDAIGHVTIDAENWIARPPGYVTVNLDGALTGSGRTMRGDVRGPEGVETRCRRFSLDRKSAKPDVPGLCRGTIARLSGHIQ
jgi:hypothetical protein